jgi:SulP family sulfate permease
MHAGLLLIAATSLFLFPWSAYIPLSLTAALLIHTSLTAVDGWSRDLLLKMRGPGRSRKELRTNLLVVLLVTIVMVVFNLTSAVVAGFIATMFLFIGEISRSIIQRSYDLGERHSLRVRDAEAMEFLARHRTDACIVELEGPIFFGTADMLAGDINALGKNARVVLLDLRQVGNIDATGALILTQIAATLQMRNQRLLLSHLTPDDNHWYFLVDMGVNQVLPEAFWFADLDRALEWIEDHLLESCPSLRQATEELPIASVSLTADLDAAGLAALCRVLERRVYAQGEYLFREGDNDNCVFVLVRGQVSVQLPPTAETRGRRLGTYGPGVMFGEMALLEGKPRSADGIADTASTLLLNISRELANRLRVTTLELRATN